MKVDADRGGLLTGNGEERKKRGRLGDREETQIAAQGYMQDEQQERRQSKEVRRKKYLKMRLSHWFKMLNGRRNWKRRWIFFCFHYSSMHTDTAHCELEHRLYIASLHESNESQNSIP